MPPPCPWQFIRQEDCQMRKPAQLQNGLCVDSWLGGSLRRWTFWSFQLDSPKRASVGEVCWNTFCRRVRRRWCQAVHVLHSMSMASNQLWKWRERRSGEVAKYLKHLETVLPNGPSVLMTRIPAWDGGKVHLGQDLYISSTFSFQHRENLEVRPLTWRLGTRCSNKDFLTWSK